MMNTVRVAFRCASVLSFKITHSLFVTVQLSDIPNVMFFKLSIEAADATKAPMKDLTL